MRSADPSRPAPPFRSGRSALCGSLAWLLTAGSAVACTIPVFRYALDRWEADPYRLVIPAAWATDREKVKLLVPLRGNGIANLAVEESAEPATGRARILFPGGEPFREGDVDPASLAALLDSPARRELLARLLAGDSVVWVVAEPGRERGGSDRVAARLRFLEQVAVLPAQDPDDPESRLGPGPPLRLAFSVLALSLDDPAERDFLAMLAGPEHADFLSGGVPFAAPVFGRGRVLDAWPLAELDETTIEEASLFLTGRCSCRVKEQNPGWDLLLKVDWEASLVAADEATGPAAPLVPEAAPGALVPAKAAAPETVVTTAEPAPPPPPDRRIFSPATIGAGFAALLAIAAWILWRFR